ncbi:MAG: sigma-70 family RNA polymerase sigma factor [Acidobacteria bacterium]|nr:sigma-70 family RNA polymerase sigma factor [Acidobacteriota bacterium]
MAADPSSDVTRMLREWSAGDPSAADRLLPVVYAELRRLAAGYLKRERTGHTLQPTALVNEAWMKLAGQNAPWQNRAHFLGVAAGAMRRILVDHARRRQAQKRGGSELRVTLTDAAAPGGGSEIDLVRLDEALERLAALDERQAKMVTMRFFAGLTVEETAEALGVSEKTVKRDWAAAKAYLHRELGGGR